MTSRPLSNEVLTAVDSALTSHGFTWIELIQHCTPVTGNGNGQTLAANNGNAPSKSNDYSWQNDRADVSSQWVKAAAEAILKSNARITPNAQTFVAQTFARASQYDTVKFSPKQWEWFNKIMVSAGVEALDGGQHG